MKIFEVILILSIITPSVISMIITSVFAGPKKYKSITFDLFPLPFSYAVPNKMQFAYRGHYTFRRPNFNINMAVPVALPLNFHPVNTGPNDINLNDGVNDAYQNAASDEENEPTHAVEDEQPAEEASETEGHHSTPPKFTGYENQEPAGDGNGRLPTPYTGKAQVSSFIDNGQFVNAHSPVSSSKTVSGAGAATVMEDAAFGDEGGDTSYSDERSSVGPLGFRERHQDIRRKGKGKTISLGYEELGQMPTAHPYTVHARHPDSLPWGMTDYEDIHKYYSTFQFTDSLRAPYQKRRGLLSAGFIFG